MHFAEFLNASSLERLRFLILHTCVGFGTVGSAYLSGIISWRLEYALFALLLLRYLSRLISERFLRSSLTYRLGRDNRRPAGVLLTRHPTILNPVQEYEPVSHRLRLSPSP